MTVDNFGVTQSIGDAQRTYLNGVTFDNRGVLSQINFGNGTSETYSHNDRFQMTSQSLNKGAEILQKYDYSYGQTDLTTGNIDATKNNGQLGKIESFIGTNKQASQRFEYDSIGRLSESREHRGDTNALTYKQKFDFDRFGNLYRKAASNPTTGQANPLPYTPIEDSDISKSTNQFTTGTTYNEAGQVITDNKFRGGMNFAYDANGRNIKVSQTNVPDAWTVYDALGNRVATKINEVWQYLIYDAYGKLVAEYGAGSEGTGGVKYIQQDWQGSVRAVTNNGGFVVSRTDHQAFGDEVGAGVGMRTTGQGYSSGKVSRQGYGLTENDQGSGQQHTWFRKLETQAGRWSSPDPYKGSMSLGNPQSFNRYSYVENQPINYIDPSGLAISICEIRDGVLDCSGGGGYGYYTRTWNINIGDGRTYPLTFDFPTFGGYNGGRRGGGGGGPQVTPYLRFDGCTLNYIDNKGTIQGSWKAYSGNDGTTQENQYESGKGPIPEGTYEVDPANTQYRFDTSIGGLIYSHVYWANSGAQGRAWGDYRTTINAVNAETKGRSGFFLHGGATAGSAGCIDLVGGNNDFHQWFKQNGQKLQLKVTLTCNPW